MKEQLFLIITFLVAAIKAVTVYDNTNFDNNLIPESIKECALYYSNNITNKYNKNADYYKIIPELLPGYESIQNDEIYIKPKDMYSGKISIDEEKQHSLFFWKFLQSERSEYSKISKKDSLILFINGGPGCSSMDGLLLENGPFRVNSNSKLIANNGSWHMHSDIVYLDQPLGTGFSTKLNSKETNLEFYDSDLDAETSSNLIKFLIEYYKVFPEDINKKLIIAGESYAGQYILHFTNNIWKFNNIVGKTVIKLDTVMMGNAWVDPIEQSSAYLPFFQEQGLFDSNNRLFKHLLNQQEECQKTINSIDINSMTSFDVGTCESIMYSFISSLFSSKDSKCLNVYDYRIEESAPSCGANWPHELPFVGSFFKHEGVEEALHIIDLDDDFDNNDKTISWNECSNKVYANLKNEISAVPAIRFLPQLLEQGLNLYLFNGDKDIICNRLGVENYVKKLSWNGEQFSKNAKWHSWIHENTQVGQFLKDRNVTLINIFNGSHMVPYDKPMETRALFHIIDLMESNKNIKQEFLADADYEIKTFNGNLKRESIVFYDSDGNETEVFREIESQSSDDNKKGEDSDENQSSDREKKVNKQDHSLIPNWILIIVFFVLAVYLIKYILDTLFSNKSALMDSSMTRLNGNDIRKDERLDEDLEACLGTTEFDIELEDSNVDVNNKSHVHIDLNND
ncbi:hypothetical protein QEN19_000066 [Hanseniaspora menglaensis]